MKEWNQTNPTGMTEPDLAANTPETFGNERIIDSQAFTGQVEEKKNHPMGVSSKRTPTRALMNSTPKPPTPAISPIDLNKLEQNRKIQKINTCAATPSPYKMQLSDASRSKNDSR